MTFTSEDRQQIQEHGLSVEQIKEQLKFFEKGTPYIEVITPATFGNGIEEIDHNTQRKLIRYYENRRDSLDIVKFVPASGAATRMFNFLHRFLEDFDLEEDHLHSYIKFNNHEDLKLFFSRLKEFAFMREARKKIRELYPDYKMNTIGTRMYLLVQTLLNEEGLNFNNMPKGLIPFHKYLKNIATAFEEQLFEATQYAASDGTAHIHFTFAPKHVEQFKNEYEAIRKRIQHKTRIKLKISYSFQEPSTDTIALKTDNTPFRGENGKLVFRPSGHGALLKNLGEMDADVVFIKNIDNVSVDDYAAENTSIKKMLAGKLLQLQEQIFDYLTEIIKRDVSEELLIEMKAFVWNQLYIRENPATAAGIAEIINRPLRVCGVVLNTGAPGGGPFWIKNEENDISLQIVEMSQIDNNDPHQLAVIKDATHFNPVDMVCAMRDYNGDPFNLEHFADPNACFISNKTINGQPIKALELPGLWNGGMAKWNTVFIEVPESTFNPVKTVNDLLSPFHRPNA